MPTEVLTPIADGTPDTWAKVPTTPTTRYDKVDEGYLTYDVADYMSASTNLLAQQLVFEVPAARNISAVSNVRVYFPFYGLLGASSGMAVTIDVYGNGVLKGTTTIDADTGGLTELAYVDIPVTSFGQAEADAVSVTFTFLVNPTGGPYPEPNIYVIP